MLKPCADGNADSRGAAGPARSGMRAPASRRRRGVPHRPLSVGQGGLRRDDSRRARGFRLDRPRSESRNSIKKRFQFNGEKIFWNQMTAIAILTIAGVLLIFAETLAMCGAFFAAGALAFAGAAAAAFFEFGAWALAGVGAAFLLSCALALVFWSKIVPNTRFSREIYLKSSESGKSPARDHRGARRARGIGQDPPLPVGGRRSGRRVVRRLVRRRALRGWRKSLRGVLLAVRPQSQKNPEEFMNMSIMTIVR